MRKISNLLDKVDTSALKRDFLDACGDKEFLEYTNTLPIEEELLSKYTQKLKDSFQEFKNCQNCQNLDLCKNSVKGYQLTPLKNIKTIDFSLMACPKYKKYLDTSSYTKNIYFYQIPKEIKTATFKNIYKDDKQRVPIVKYFKEFMDNYNNEVKPKGIYLNGSFGSGKTYLIAALFNEMAKKNIKSTIIYYPEFLRSLKASFQTDYKERFNQIKKTPLLLFDDIGAENNTAWSRDEVLGPILQYRMDENLPTFFTSNLTVEELEKNLTTTTYATDLVKARRIIERIKQLTIDIKLISKNRRG